MKPLPILILLLSLVHVSTAYADELTLKNGDRLTGKVIRMEDEKLSFETSYAGKIMVDWAEVSSLKVDKKINVVLSKDTLLKGSTLPSEAGEMKMKLGKIVDTVSFKLSEVKAIDPKPQKSKPHVRTKGHINIGITATEGNSETETQHLDGEFVARTEKNRFTLSGELNRAQEEEEKTVNNALASLKYDHFVSEKWFLYSNASFEKDEFKGLDLRSSLGGGAGYQIIETDTTNLSLEAGLSYVNEDFEEAEDESYPGGRWALKLERHFWERILQFFHFHEGLQGLQDRDDIFIRSRTGIRLPIYKSLETTVQYNYDWDKSPEPGREKADEKYLLTLGYHW